MLWYSLHGKKMNLLQWLRWSTVTVDKRKLFFIADRGYETYNIFAHVQEKEMYYLIRVKDGGRGSMTGSFLLPDKDEFDH